jgi:enoyl-CoA hydratase/carnithine racemase
MMKRMVRESADLTVAEGIRRERELVAEYRRSSPDSGVGLKAFATKEAPTFPTQRRT